MSEEYLRITLNFERGNDERTQEEFSHTFVSDESLGPVLEKLEMFLQQMGFVIDGKELHLARKESSSDYIFTDDNMSYGSSENIALFPTGRE